MTNKETRFSLIRQLEAARPGGRVLTLVTSSRAGLEAQLSGDSLHHFHRHLESFGSVDRIDLFLYTLGGDTLLPWRLISILREYASEIAVLAPYYALSAGTLIALGADSVVMGKMGALSPVDPAVANQFNPQDPMRPQARINISVEDVTAYLTLARRHALGIESASNGVDDTLDGGQVPDEAIPAMTQVFGYLANQVHPLALGNVQRSHSLIRKLATRLLEHRPAKNKSEEQIKRIVSTLTESLFSHQYLIGRTEAREIGIDVEIPENQVELLMWKLYEAYAEDAEMLVPFNPVGELGGTGSLDKTFDRAYIESAGKSDVFQTQAKLLSVGQPPSAMPGLTILPTAQTTNVVMQIERESWNRIA